MMRWGFPPPPNLGNAPVTNVRNLKSSYLARMAQGRMALSRAGNLILRMDRQPAEGNPLVCARRMPAAFCLCGDLAAWTGEGEDETGEHQLLAFLTSESNDIVPVQAKVAGATHNGRGVGYMDYGVGRSGNRVAYYACK